MVCPQSMSTHGYSTIEGGRTEYVDLTITLTHCSLPVAPERIWRRDTRMSGAKRRKNVLSCPSTFLVLQVQLVVLVSAFVMVSTVGYCAKPSTYLLIEAGRLKTRDLTSRDWTTRYHIAKGGHRETWFIVRVEAQHKLIFAAGSIIWAAHRLYVCIQARNQGGFGWFVRTPHAITLVRLVRFSYMYSAS